ncbi:helix-turn-helix domain-containing protein [Ruminococcaceae bacterium OttesenSCG-928-I18]|nr:helix-turn-helix domain-containing protein [Ruminococcaceae bacterium OttesenSCG-928-I18]
MASLTERLEELKLARNVLQKDIAKAAGLSLRTYQRYEYGEREPSTSVLIALADYFDVSLDYLVGRSNSMKRQP